MTAALPARAVTGNAADEEQVAKAGERSQFRAKQADNDLRTLMENEYGRRFMCRLLVSCGMWMDDFSESHAVMSRMSGRRSVGLQQMQDIGRVCPELYDVMMKEARDA